MNENDRKLLVDEIVDALSNGNFKGEILERFDTVEEKLDNHCKYDEHCFNVLTNKTNEHEKSLKKIKPITWYIGLASSTSKIVRGIFWVSLLLIFIVFQAVDWKALGNHVFERVVGTQAQEIIKK